MSWVKVRDVQAGKRYRVDISTMRGPGDTYRVLVFDSLLGKVTHQPPKLLYRNHVDPYLLVFMNGVHYVADADIELEEVE